MLFGHPVELLGNGPRWVAQPPVQFLVLVTIEPLPIYGFYMFLSVSIPFYNIFPSFFHGCSTKQLQMCPSYFDPWRRRSRGAAPLATSRRGWAKLRAQRHCGSLLWLGGTSSRPFLLRKDGGHKKNQWCLYGMRKFIINDYQELPISADIKIIKRIMELLCEGDGMGP